jgi:putative SOS response-associated peptidase YedK
MCSRYTPADESSIRKEFHPGLLRLSEPPVKPVIFPGYYAPIVFAPMGERIAEVRFWGFITRIPGKRDPKSLLEKIMQNAVSETVDEKRTFKGAWDKSQRCIIPALNFMEPKAGQFVPIISPERPVLAIAGIWGEVTYKEQKHAAYTMLTCEPNSFMEEFHDRMPVILKPDDVDEWLSPDTPPDQAKKLCRPYKGKLTFAEKAGT